MYAYGNSMFLATHGILARSGGGGASLLLDTYTGAAVAYSLRQLRTAYTGAAIRVRRSSDNAEQDIGFVGGDLDTTSMLNFVGNNLWTYSEDISQAVWAKTNLNTTGTPPYLDVEIAPDGLTTGDKIIENTTSGTHQVSRQLFTILNSTSYNISVYLKQGERTKVQIASNISGVLQTCDVDLTNGNISNNGFANTPAITSEANGWYRFSVTITSGLTSSSPLTVRLMNPTTSYLGDGTSGAYVWGAQLTQSSSVLTYEKTVADAARNGFVTTWYDQSGNANNANQPTLLSSQSQIVSSGAVITDPNTGKISTTWTADNYTISNVAVTQNMLMSAVVNRTATNNNLFIFGSTSATPSLYAWGNTGNATTRISGSTVTHETGYTTTGAYIMSALRDSSDIAKAWRNTTALTTGSATGGVGTAFFTRFGTSSATSMTARCVEAIFWNNDKESSRADIVTNQNTYWEVY
jgi:hypothetical protein